MNLLSFLLSFCYYLHGLVLTESLLIYLRWKHNKCIFTANEGIKLGLGFELMGSFNVHLGSFNVHLGTFRVHLGSGKVHLGADPELYLVSP